MITRTCNASDTLGRWQSIARCTYINLHSENGADFSAFEEDATFKHSVAVEGSIAPEGADQSIHEMLNMLEDEVFEGFKQQAATPHRLDCRTTEHIRKTTL